MWTLSAMRTGDPMGVSAKTVLPLSPPQVDDSANGRDQGPAGHDRNLDPADGKLREQGSPHQLQRERIWLVDEDEATDSRAGIRGNEEEHAGDVPQHTGEVGDEIAEVG